MNYRHLPLACGDCGEIPEQIMEVGFTQDHQLVIHWWCGKCNRVVYLAKPLVDCWRECPREQESLDYRLEELQKHIQDEDARFLKSLGVEPTA